MREASDMPISRFLFHRVSRLAREPLPRVLPRALRSYVRWSGKIFWPGARGAEAYTKGNGTRVYVLHPLPSKSKPLPRRLPIRVGGKRTA